MNTKAFDEIAPRIANDLREAIPAWFKEDVCAALGNFGVESAGFTAMQEKRPLVKGSKGGWGWAQWTGPRRRAFERHAKEHGHDPASYEANMAFLLYELKGEYKSVIGKVKRAKTLKAKVRAFMDGFEKPGIPHLAARERWAEQAMTVVNGSVPPTPEKEKSDVTPGPTDAITDVDVVRRQQQYLNNLKYHCGDPDGIVGPLTQSAIRDFRAAHGMKPMPVGAEYINMELIQAIQLATKPREIAPERAEAGEKQVANRFTMVWALIKTRLTALVIGIGAFLGSVFDFLTGNFDTAQEWYAKIQPYAPKGWMIWAGVAAVMAFLWWQARQGAQEAKSKFNDGSLL